MGGGNRADEIKRVSTSYVKSVGGSLPVSQGQAVVELVQSDDSGGTVKTGHVHATQADSADADYQSSVAGDGAQGAGGTKTGGERLDHGGRGRADAIGDRKTLAKVKEIVFLEDTFDRRSAEEFDIWAKIIPPRAALAAPAADSARIAGD